MATILNAYDLSGGDTTSTASTNVTDYTIHWVWGGTQEGSVKMTIKASENGASSVALKDENRKPHEITLHAVRSDQMEDRYTIYGVNSASVTVEVEPSEDATGTLTIDTYTT